MGSGAVVTWRRSAIVGSASVAVAAGVSVFFSASRMLLGSSGADAAVPVSIFWDLRFSFARRFCSSLAAFSSASRAFRSSLSCSIED